VLTASSQNYLKSDNPAVRGAVIQALRFTLADTSQSYNTVLIPLLAPMLTSMLVDPELENHRLALTTLNSAIHNKLELILPSLPLLLPLVMQDSYIKKELVREVKMGPFTHKVDDGLEIRKVCSLSLPSAPHFSDSQFLQSAYETLYALLDSPILPRTDLPAIYARIIDGVSDEHDIRVLANLMILKLIVLAPDETKRNLDALAEQFRKVLGVKAKENAVKQEIEKLAEANKGVVRVSWELNRAFPGMGVQGSPGGKAGDASFGGWRGYWEWVRNEFGRVVREVEEEG
jgi:cullin-associated NEDD8-dissociated protein 1